MDAEPRSGNDVDHGKTVETKCPGCSEAAWFHLVQKQPRDRLLSLLRLGKSWALKCSSCGFSLPIRHADVAGAQRLNENYKAFEEGRVTTEQLREVWAETPLTVLHDLRNDADLHKCPKCGEENPNAFTNCWSCDTEF